MRMRKDGTPETRGGQTKKYDFERFEINEVRSFENTSIRNIRGSAKSFANARGLRWKFRCWTVGTTSYIKRLS